MVARSLQFLDIDGFWGERKINEERYYSDSFIKYVIVIEGFNECVLFPAMAARFMFEVAMDPVQLSFFTLKPNQTKPFMNFQDI